MGILDFTTELQHIGIPTKDINRTIAFYKGLGFEVSLNTRNEAADEYVCFLRLKNLCIETWETKNVASETGAIDHIALNVSDIERTFQQISEGEYNILDTEIQFLPFWENGVRFFNVLGPNGEKVEFSQIL